MVKIFKRKSNQDINGFSLLETVVAVGILAFVIIGPLGLAQRSISFATTSKNQTIASHLAQEAIEYIRNKRDGNFLANDDWLSGMESCVSVNGCYIDAIDDVVTACSGSCPFIKYDESSHHYYNSPAAAGKNTVFRRKIVLERINDHEYELEVTLSWQERFGIKTIIVEENIFNWK